MTEVDLEDGDKPVQVQVEFIAPVDVKLERNNPKLIEGFRVLQVSGSQVAFRAPVEVELHGENVRGALNTVHLRVISSSDYLIMKALAIGGRDKPKDAYDLCYCLRNCPGMETLAADWKARATEIEVGKAKRILHEKFGSVDAFGPRQLAEFHSSTDKDGQDMEARRAFEVVQKFLNLLK